MSPVDRRRFVLQLLAGGAALRTLPALGAEGPLDPEKAEAEMLTPAAVGAIDKGLAWLGPLGDEFRPFFAILPGQHPGRQSFHPRPQHGNPRPDVRSRLRHLVP